MTDPIRDLPPPATEQDWAALHSFGGEFGGPAKRCLFDLRDRLAAVEARLAQVGVPATTADGLSPVEPAPQAPQVVTVEELEALIAFGLMSVGDNAEKIASSLWDNPRIGLLLERLRGKGAPAAARAEVARQQGGQADG